jgi:3-hydroxybutyryl-CoA dehydrogenase
VGKVDDEVDPATSRRAVVVGGGTMGAGIAQVLLGAGAEVVLVEASPEAAATARDRVVGAVQRAAASGRPNAPLVEILHRFTAQGDFSFDGPVDLVIEAVPEHIPLKKDVLVRAVAACPGALLATNTSSLSIDKLAGELVDPSILIGLHFFNPVPASSLIEIVIGARTGPETIVRAREWTRRMDKESIEVRDSPGFATSRLGLALGLEAIRMLESGVASASDIDRGMLLGYKHPVGPLELTDRVGLDVRLAIAQHLESELGPRFSPPRLLADLVAAGHIGRKSGRGFFEWDDEGRRCG